MPQLDLLCAPWTAPLEDGGQEALCTRGDWADCEKPPLLGEYHRQLLLSLTRLDELTGLREDLAGGSFHQPVFNAANAADTAFSKEWVSQHGPGLCCMHSSSAEPIPVFRGLRVRIGIHSGTADVVATHEKTKRKVYGGRVMQVSPTCRVALETPCRPHSEPWEGKIILTAGFAVQIAKAVSDAPCGGQIIMTGEALAEMESLHSVKRKVAAKCAGWRSGYALGDSSMPAALSVMHLGTHVILSDPTAAKTSPAVDGSSPQVQTSGLRSLVSNFYGTFTRLFRSSVVVPSNEGGRIWICFAF